MSEKKPLFGILAGEPEIIGDRCADGGKCHHRCTDTCWRRTSCAPLSGSGLLFDWSAPKPAEPAPAQDDREAIEVVAYLIRRQDDHNMRGVRLHVDRSCYDARTETLDLMTVAQHERIVAALARPAQTEQQPLIYINPMVIDELEGKRKASPGGLTWSRKALAHWTFPLYAAPIAQTEPAPAQQPVGEMISNDGDIYWADRHPPMGTKLYAAPIAQTAPQPAPGESWIPWRGGECPLPPSTPVEYRMRRDARSVVRIDLAGKLDWEHHGGRIGKSDVVAYRAALSAQLGTQTAPTPWQEATGRAAFKNFHRSLCERFGYTHDDEFWWRDLISLEEHIAKLTAPQPEQSGLADVAAERRRQIEVEGWVPDHDDRYHYGELSAAAASYALDACGIQLGHDSSKNPPSTWPWHRDWWKPGDPRRMLVKAAALILAEIDRLDRDAARGGAGDE